MGLLLGSCTGGSYAVVLCWAHSRLLLLGLVQECCGTAFQFRSSTPLHRASIWTNRLSIMVDPSVVEADGWTSIGDVFQWANFPARMDNMACKSFLETLGASITDNPAPLALVAEADWAAIVNAWQIPADDTGTAALAAPSVFMAAKAGLIGRGIRIKYGMQLRVGTIAANIAAAALASSSLPSTLAVLPPPPSPGRKVKFPMWWTKSRRKRYR